MTNHEDGVAIVNKHEGDKYMEFSLAEEVFAIPLLTVKEVIGIPAISPVPFTPSYFLGIMNLRGQVLSVIDLRRKMGITSKDYDSETSVIILDLSPVSIGIAVDSIQRVLSFTTSQIDYPPEIDSKVGREYITGVFRQKNNLTVLLNIGKMLDSNELRIYRQNRKAA